MWSTRRIDSSTELAICEHDMMIHECTIAAGHMSPPFSTFYIMHVMNNLYHGLIIFSLPPDIIRTCFVPFEYLHRKSIYQ